MSTATEGWILAFAYAVAAYICAQTGQVGLAVLCLVCFLVIAVLQGVDP